MNNSADNHLVVVGLGNPGKRYELTRHNIGAIAVAHWAKALGWPFKDEKRFCAQIAKGQHAGKTVHLLLPQTYMNDSGRAVRTYLDFYRLPISRLVVVSDEIALPFGVLRLRDKGSAGGHNGLRSIEQLISSQQYARLRIGIGKQPTERSLADFVLDLFKPEELVALPSVAGKAVDIFEALLSHPVAEVASRFNG